MRGTVAWQYVQDDIARDKASVAEFQNQISTLAREISQYSDRVQVLKVKLEKEANKGPSIRETVSGTNDLQFDYASINWNDDDYKDFFKKLSNQDRRLNYALTVREWSKTLTVSGKLGGNANDKLFARIDEMVAEEYDGTVFCAKQVCVILSEEASEEIHGILLTPSKEELGFDHVLLFVNLMKLGKNLCIRFYTLFKPTADTLEMQAKQSISLKNRLNPNIKAYEEAVRESTLRSIEEFMNDSSGKPAPQADGEPEQEKSY